MISNTFEKIDTMVVTVNDKKQKPKKEIKEKKPKNEEPQPQPPIIKEKKPKKVSKKEIKDVICSPKSAEIFNIDDNNIDNKISAELNNETNTKEIIETTPYSHLGEYIEEPFQIIESYFHSQYLERLVRFQVESYNHFVNYQIQRTIQMFNPVIIHSENDYVAEYGQYFLEIQISFENFKLYPPQIHENNGATKVMLPQEAKLRNFTYSSGMTVDVIIKYIVRNTEEMNTPKIYTKILPKINIGKMPIMVKSAICVLTQNKHIPASLTGECEMDCGGYFIVKGSEKTVLGQERAAENKIYCFDGKNTTKWSWYAEIKSVPDHKCISPKQIEMGIANKNNGFGNGIYMTIPRIKQPIELFVVFRALGVISDKEICKYILLDIENSANLNLLNMLQASIIDANKILTKEDALKYITSFTSYTPINMDKETGIRKKREFTLEVLNNDLFPHCKTTQQKIYLIGYMARRLMQVSIGLFPPDDRDSFVNKRIELTGTLLNNLFRNYFNKLVKEMQKQVTREINTGSWHSNEDYENIINMTNIYKIMKSTTIENGINRALATGDFSIKQSNSSKVGVAQVLNRLTYLATLSHLRRINTPLEKSGELIAPRKLHNTTWGYLCCLTGDTEILMANRIDTKKIKDICDGDWVNTVNRTTLMDEPSQMYNKFCLMPEKLFEITTISGRKIKATADHPFLVVSGDDKYKMKTVADLKEGADSMIIRQSVNDIFDINTIKLIIELYKKYPIDLLEASTANLAIPLYKLENAKRFIGTDNENKYYDAKYWFGENFDTYDDEYLNESKKWGFETVMIRREPNNCFSVPILSIREIPPELVYDFTTRSENHSFVADSFVSSNCAESPEGQSIGIVKNLSYMAHITSPTNSSSLYEYVAPYITTVDAIEDQANLFKKIKVFINGIWLGITETPQELYEEMKNKKHCGILNIYTSIVFDYKLGEIRVCNDGGRLVRPLLRVKNGKALISQDIIKKLNDKKISWNDLLTNCNIEESVIEYIDPEEQNLAMIALNHKPPSNDDNIKSQSQSQSQSQNINSAELFIKEYQEKNQEQITLQKNYILNYTHCEIHHSTIFGLLASCIPFPEHNQSPRNCYQCCMSKQAIGVFSLNFDHRMDKTAYVLTTPSRPIVDTRLMNIIKLNRIPSGHQIHLAIMCYTGYNMEDSILINQGAIDRGLFSTTIYHTEKDEDKNIVRDEIVRCKPDKTKTKCIKFGNYDKLNADGFIPENTLVENRDVIIAKILPIKENRNDPTKLIKYEDQSKTYRTTEETYIDKNYTGRNGDGYDFAKVRTRIFRKPVIGDKFSSRSGQKGTCGNIIPECDMPYTKNGLRPDFIINPHAIPSRMTIAQLKETLLGKILLELGLFGDGTSFGNLDIKTISMELQKLGYESHGDEIMYNGMTGEQIETPIFFGPVYYQRLKHMVNDKQHSRSIGPMVNLTRQPAEGRSRDGGFRIGEMERDVMIAHGMTRFCRERLYDVSDKYSVNVCNKCGMIAAYNNGEQNRLYKSNDFTIHLCKTCNNTTDFSKVEIPYSYKLLSQELQTINVAMRLITNK